MKKKDPPGYPGDEAVRKAFGETLRKLRIEKSLSLEQAEEVLRKAMQENAHQLLPRAMGIVVRQLREQQKMSRAQLSSASGLPVRFITNLERGKARNATLTDIVRISFGLNHPITDLVERIEECERKLNAK